MVSCIGERKVIFSDQIDFGKSKYQGNVQGYKRTTDNDYTAPDAK